MRGVIVFAHGSSVATANEAVRKVSAEMARIGGHKLVETAFLEAAPPSLAEAVDAIAARGATDIVVVPYFLTLGIHLQRDLPRIVEEIRGSHPEVSIRVQPPLDGHPAMAQALADRAALD